MTAQDPRSRDHLDAPGGPGAEPPRRRRLTFARVRVVVLVGIMILLIGSRALFATERVQVTWPAVVLGYGVPIAATALLACAMTRRPGDRRFDVTALSLSSSAFAVLCSTVNGSVVVTPALGVVLSVAATIWATVSRGDRQQWKIPDVGGRR
ncbi:hypothetical protein VH571_10605 [Frondihabitans sp. 4ASC-45]|uniref:hypothetical protein n=1 Tax=Frondihabitans sp. 4ASC-45 TaxID=3111636 RepID=UPI003C1597FF